MRSSVNFSISFTLISSSVISINSLPILFVDVCGMDVEERLDCVMYWGCFTSFCCLELVFDVVSIRACF